MLKTVSLVAALLLAAGPARADWLERAWDAASAAKNGAPAVTLTQSGILLVLPEATLAEAHAAGVETPQAVQLFLRRYGQHCSAVLDLDRAHENIRVKLFTLRPVPLEEASERVQGEVLDALKSAGSKHFPRVRDLFVADDQPSELTIDYKPERKANCVRPGEPVS
jgi:hypothetical protein